MAAKKSDPFATDNDTTEDTEETVTETISTADTPAVASGEVSVTLKGGTGFDAPWVVLRAATPADALDLLSDADVLKNLLDRTAKIGKYFAEQGGGSSNGGGGQAAKPARQQAPNGEARQCEHGEMVYKTGVGKNNGKPWKAFMCPSNDRNDQCDPQWLK